MAGFVPKIASGVIVCVFLLSLWAAPSAANGIGYVQVTPSEVEAQPGGSFQVTLYASSYPQSSSGAVKATVGISFSPEYLEVTGFEQPDPSWLEGGQETTIKTHQREVDNEDGFAILSQERDPWAGGVTSGGTFAIVTFNVSEDAPLGTKIRLQIAAAEIVLTDGQGQQIDENPAVLEITENPSSPTPTRTVENQDPIPTSTTASNGGPGTTTTESGTTATVSKTTPIESPFSPSAEASPPGGGQGPLAGVSFNRILQGVVVISLIAAGLLLVYIRSVT